MRATSATGTGPALGPAPGAGPDGSAAGTPPLPAPTALGLIPTGWSEGRKFVLPFTEPPQIANKIGTRGEGITYSLGMAMVHYESRGTTKAVSLVLEAHWDKLSAAAQADGTVSPAVPQPGGPAQLLADAALARANTGCRATIASCLWLAKPGASARARPAVGSARAPGLWYCCI